MFTILTALKLEVSFLSGFPLSRETPRAVWFESDKMFCSILELINLPKSGVKKSTASFIVSSENGIYSKSTFGV